MKIKLLLMNRKYRHCSWLFSWQHCEDGCKFSLSIHKIQYLLLMMTILWLFY